jgi:hypothetical protein
MATPKNLGSDISGITGLDWALSTVSGRLALAQAILRRLTSARGSLLGTPTYGYDLLQTIGSTVPRSVVEQRVLEQVMYEEEVEDASVTVNLENDRLKVLINVTDGDGPFRLTVDADALTAQAMIDDNPAFWRRAA